MAAESGARKQTVTEAVAVFHDVSSLEAAVDDLRKAGFKRGDISLLASEDAIEKKLGHRYERVEELEDAPDAPRVVYRTRTSVGESEDLIVGSLTYLPAVLAAGTVVASAGIVAAAVTGTAIAGALIGTVLARWLDMPHQYFEVTVGDGRRFVLRQDVVLRTWELAAVFAASKPRPRPLPPQEGARGATSAWWRFGR